MEYSVFAPYSCCTIQYYDLSNWELELSKDTLHFSSPDFLGRRDGFKHWSRQELCQERQAAGNRGSGPKMMRRKRDFRADSPKTPSKPSEKFFGNFPYPYMNGLPAPWLCILPFKMEFASAYHRLKGANVLLPSAFHCTGMPIKVSADKLSHKIEIFGDPPLFPSTLINDPNTEMVEEAVVMAGKFRGKK